MLFNFLIALFIGFELQKLFQFRIFFKLKCISSDYNQIIQKKYNVVSKALLKIAFVDLLYIIVTFIGIFTINNLFFISIILISYIQTLIFKLIKNKIIRKISFIIEIVTSITLLLLIITNIFFFNMEEIDLIKHLINLF